MIARRHTHTVGAVKRKGFTIIQLVIGMLIFAILTGIAFFGISIYTAQANETRVASDLGTFEVAIKDYILNNPGACSDGTLNPVGLNHYLTKENALALDEADPNKDDLGSEISVAAGIKGEAAYKKLSVLEYISHHSPDNSERCNGYEKNISRLYLTHRHNRNQCKSNKI